MTGEIQHQLRAKPGPQRQVLVQHALSEVANERRNNGGSGKHDNQRDEKHPGHPRNIHSLPEAHAFGKTNRKPVADCRTDCGKRYEAERHEEKIREQ